MILLPPRAPRPVTLLPFTTLFRSIACGACIFVASRRCAVPRISASPPLFASAVAAAVAGAVFAAGVAAYALAVGGVPVDCDSAAVVGAGAAVADSCASAGNENTGNARRDAYSAK